MRSNFVAVIVVLVLASGCATFVVPQRELSRAESLFENRKYADAIAIYRTLMRSNSNTASAAEARYALAYTLAYYDNPQRDYGQALQEFEEFLKLYPDHRKAQDAKNWRQVLRTVDTLNKSIEQLKQLDKKIEQKRKMR